MLRATFSDQPDKKQLKIELSVTIFVIALYFDYSASCCNAAITGCNSSVIVANQRTLHNVCTVTTDVMAYLPIRVRKQ